MIRSEAELKETLRRIDSIACEFLARAVDLERDGNVREALSLVYRRINEMMELEKFDILDQELQSVSAEEIGTDLLLGLLTATLPVKSRLAFRPTLLKSTKRLLKARGHFERGILDGLK
jgi:hypothetical protein